MYAEYTIAVIDLAHLNTELSRYRATILRAVQAGNLEEFKRILETVPAQRSRLRSKLSEFAEMDLRVQAKKEYDFPSVAQIADLDRKLVVYLSASDQTIDILRRNWDASTGEIAVHVRSEAEAYARNDVGGKFIAMTQSLDDLISQVATTAAAIRSDGEKTVRILTVAMLACTLFFCFAVLIKPGHIWR
jgi:hypothetical protein